MADGEKTLEAAAAALHAAQGAVRAACRRLSAGIVEAYRGGEPVARIAKRTGRDVLGIRNLLAAAQTTRSSR
ncbi:hypothetical protein [Streptomyces sp. NPDC051909]|uniref:hypothetical protein n=1 Tax=Streptomyces sp. NPDC051909 TaxID=3154944 RepID=UPI0034134CE0